MFSSTGVLFTCLYLFCMLFQKLESLLGKCETAARYLISASHEMATVDCMPTSVTEGHLFLRQHAECVQSVVENAALLDLHSWEEQLVDLQEGCEPEITALPEHRSATSEHYFNVLML